VARKDGDYQHETFWLNVMCGSNYKFILIDGGYNWMVVGGGEVKVGHFEEAKRIVPSRNEMSPGCELSQ